MGKPVKPSVANPSPLYLLEQNLLKTVWYVKKDGHTVATVSTYEEATTSVDAVLGPRGEEA